MRQLFDSRFGRTVQRWALRPRRTRIHDFHYEHVLGTSLELRVIAERESAARRAEAAVLAEVDRLEPILSGWSATSELVGWLATHDVDAPVSPELAEVLHASAAWRKLTGGAFDPSAQAVIDRLRGDSSDGTALDPARALVGGPLAPLWQVDRAAGTARRLTRHAVSLDSIAKGYIVSRAASLGRRVPGVADVLLNIGGDVQHFGERAAAVAVADPFAPAENAPPIAKVRIHNAALCTSGGYRRGFITNGRRVSHIVDPRTGQPAERIASASVLAPDCATADALSTAFSVMAPQESVTLADSLVNVGCLVVEHDGTVTTNAVWDARAVAPRDQSILER